MEQIFYIIGFVILLVLANHFMKKVKDDPSENDEDNELIDKK